MMRASAPAQLLHAEGAAGLGAQINWPFKGEDYEANVLIDTLDFATIHSYPGDCLLLPTLGTSYGHVLACLHAHLLCAPHAINSGA